MLSPLPSTRVDLSICPQQCHQINSIRLTTTYAKIILGWIFGAAAARSMMIIANNGRYKLIGCRVPVFSPEKTASLSQKNRFCFIGEASTCTAMLVNRCSDSFQSIIEIIYLDARSLSSWIEHAEDIMLSIYFRECGIIDGTKIHCRQ